jgi:replicative DNA helicase
MINQITENKVLGCAIQSPTSLPYIIEYVKPDDFYNSKYSVIFGIIKELYDRKIQISITEITKIIYDRKLDDSYARLFVDVLPAWTGGDIKQDVKDLVEDSNRRKLNLMFKDAVNIISDKGNPLEQFCHDVDNQIRDIMRNRNAEIVKMSQLATGDIKDLIDDNRSFRTGIRDLDAEIFGLRQSRLIILAAETGFGKTALAGNIALHMADNYRSNHVLFISLEMESNELRLRFISQEARVDSFVIERGKYESEDDRNRVIEAMKKIDNMSNLNIMRDKYTLPEIIASIKQFALTNKLSLVVVDYLQLISNSIKGATREREISEISRQLKLLAMDIQTPILALSQLSRKVDGRANKEPQLSDLRESGAIEQNANMVIFLYQDLKEIEKELRTSNTYLLKVAKNRGGKRGFAIELFFHPQFTLFECI